MGKSLVWKLFTKQNSIYAKCDICKGDYKSSGNTSNLLDHAKRKHPIEFNAIKKSVQTESEDNETDVDDVNTAGPSRKRTRTIVDCLNKIKMYDRNSIKKQKLDRLLIQMITIDLEPFKIVEHQGFSNFVKELNNQYKLPTRNELKDKLFPEMYSIVKQKLLDILKNVKHAALTTDTWISPANEGILSLTCHFIYENSLKSATLETRHIIGHHTGVHIAEVIDEILINWGIREKIVAITTDNAANMVAAVNLLKVRHMACFAHTLNLVVTDVLKEDCLQNILKCVKNIVTYFRSSTLAADKLRQLQEAMNMTPLKLLQETPTRWNSTYYMIKRLLVVRDPLIIAISTCPNAPNSLTAKEFLDLEDLVKLLAPFEMASNDMSGDQYLTISLVLPMIQGIYKKLYSLQDQICTETGKIILQKLKEIITKRLVPYENRTATILGTILDPRIKKLGFKSIDQANNACTLLTNEVTAANNAAKDKSVENINPNVPTNFDTIRNKNEDDHLLSFIDVRRNECASISTPTSDAIIVVWQYLEKLHLNMTDCPLTFWKDYEPGHLKNIAYKFLCIPATSVPSERVFSNAGLFMTNRRSSLKPKNLNMLIFLR